MLKKSLILVAVLAIVMPAFGTKQDTKVHIPWPMVYQKVPVTTIDVTLDVGYYIHVKDQKAIKVSQDTSSSNPYKTYTGCKTTAVQCNFDATLTAKVVGTSPAGGKWTVTLNDGPSAQLQGTAGDDSVKICVQGSKVEIGKLVGGSKNVKVAEVTIMVVPS
jgi:hypothetical protein